MRPRRLRRGDLTLRALDFLLGMVHCRFGLIDLGHQFGNFQHRQHLSLMHVIANVDVDVLDVSATLACSSTFW